MRILIVGTLDGHIIAAGKIAIAKGAKVSNVETISDAMDYLRTGKGADLVMIDVVQPIAKFLKNLEQERIAIPVIACGIGTSTEAAVAAIQAGAKEYLPLPPEADLIGAVLAAVSRDECDILCQDPKMGLTIRLVEQVAPSDASVLLTGESGTGKEVMARYTHQKSKRKDGPFVCVNCAAIPENLLESELFGHEKGAFTGAIARRIGKFEEANGGTLLLDEITEMHPRLQAKLLRALQERVIDRVGGTAPIRVDFRLIATSNRDLREAVREKIFREDLYFRLNVVNVHVPPLRERPGDILVLAQHFLLKYAELNGVAMRPFSDTAKKALKDYEWPGNVRELENAIHRAILLSQQAQIEPSDIFLTQPIKNEEEPVSLVGKTVAEVERYLIIDTLSHCLGNRTHAATILGISIRTLRNKLKQYADEGCLITAAGDFRAAV